tara:strand:- start:47 stop:223 length:177 start_codon:yes stop_codon:yes gene_type:complete
MTKKELIKLLKAYPLNAIIQINSSNVGYSEDISYINAEDEYNNKNDFKNQVYIDLIGE